MAKKKERKKTELPSLEQELEQGADELFGDDEEDEQSSSGSEKNANEEDPPPPDDNEEPKHGSEAKETDLFGLEKGESLKGTNNVFGQAIKSAPSIKGESAIYLQRTTLNQLSRLGDELQGRYNKTPRSTANRSLVAIILDHAIAEIAQKGETSVILKKLRDGC